MDSQERSSHGAHSPTTTPRTAVPNPPRRLRIVAGLVGAVLLAGCQLPSVEGQSPTDGTDYPTPPAADTLTGPVPVSRVVDGDTLWVTTGDGDTKVRLIGVDTPELVDPRTPVQCFAQEASDFTKRALTGQSVYLEDDPSQDSIDRYGRRLAYVWTLDGRLINLDLIADGYATEYTYSTPYRYQRTFQDAEAAAAQQDRGLWNPKTCAAQR
jgi:micrococcal nuclease